MKATFAVLVRERPNTEEEALARSGLGLFGRFGSKAFIVEAETAKKAENIVKRSEKANDFEVLRAVEAEQFPCGFLVTYDKRRDAEQSPVRVVAITTNDDAKQTPVEVAVVTTRKGA